jgi:copper ion binding protein
MLKAITFEVTGEQKLHCASCEQRVERLLKAMQGVTQARARVQDQRIDVLFDEAVLQHIAIAKRLNDAGYETKVPSPVADSEKRKEHPRSGQIADMEVSVPNMVCEGCAESINAALVSLPGVLKIKAKVWSKRVHVQYEMDRASKEDVIDTLEKAGFASTLVT